MNENGIIPSNNKVYSIDGRTYFGRWEDLYRIDTSVNGTELEYIFRANYGMQRGNGLNNLMHCGEYLLFTQGSYIYRMHRATSDITILLSAENENTCFQFDVIDDSIYFVGFDKDGDFTDDVYKINIAGDQLERLYLTPHDERPFAIKTYNGWIFYMTETGIYRYKPGETEIFMLLSTRFNYMETGFAISDGHIYFIAKSYSPDSILYRIDINGDNLTELIQLVNNYVILGDWIIFNEFEVETHNDINHFHGKNIIKMKKDGTQREVIYEGIADLGGASGDWIYFSAYYIDDGLYTQQYRIRLDGTGKMMI